MRAYASIAAVLGVLATAVVAPQQNNTDTPVDAATKSSELADNGASKPSQEELAVRKIEAESRKLELEALELEKRLNEPWYNVRLLVQALVGGIVAGGLLVAWGIGYLRPILRREQEIAKLDLQKLEAENKLHRQQLAQQQEELDKRSAVILSEDQESEAELARLSAENRTLTEHQEELNRFVTRAREQVRRLSSSYRSLAKQEALSAEERVAYEDRAKEMEERTVGMKAELEAIRSALEESTARTAKLEIRSKTHAIQGIKVRVIYTAGRRAEAKRAVEVLDLHGAQAHLAETSTSLNEDHRGHIYYYFPFHKRAAQQIVELLGDIVRLEAIDSEREYETRENLVALWIV